MNEEYKQFETVSDSEVWLLLIIYNSFPIRRIALDFFLILFVQMT